MTLKIRYPEPLNKGDALGITAPSSGVAAPADIARLELLESQWKQLGYKIVEGKCLRSDFKHVSGTPLERARDLMQLWNNKNVKVIFPPWGGELLIEALPHIDFALLALCPKWVVGYSDTSTLLFALTLKTGMASLHGSNFMDTIQGQVEGVHDKALEALQAKAGAELIQNSFKKFQVHFTPFEKKVDALFNFTEKVEWKSLGGEPSIDLSGRLIGGCLDTLVHLVGTPFGDLPKFIESQSKEGVLLYLENCDLSPCHVARALWQMRFAGWFTDLNGIVLGRSSAKETPEDSSLSYVEALKKSLGDLGIPVLYDADIGHRPPQLFLINGALAKISFHSGKAELVQSLV